MYCSKIGQRWLALSGAVVRKKTMQARKLYLKFKNLASKILLILGNAPGHLQGLGFAHLNIKVVYLPKNVTVFKSCTFHIILDADETLLCH